MQRMARDAADEITRLRANLAQRTAERDPLAEMWRELSKHQEQADRDGHGESWRRMCSERTRDAARAAARDAARALARAAAYAAARDAAWAAATRDAEWAAQAIAAIRRAKEAQP
jgi:hypothetical protein